MADIPKTSKYLDVEAEESEDGSFSGDELEEGLDQFENDSFIASDEEPEDGFGDSRKRKMDLERDLAQGDIELLEDAGFRPQNRLKRLKKQKISDLGEEMDLEPEKTTSASVPLEEERVPNADEESLDDFIEDDGADEGRYQSRRSWMDSRYSSGDHITLQSVFGTGEYSSASEEEGTTVVPEPEKPRVLLEPSQVKRLYFAATDEEIIKRDVPERYMLEEGTTAVPPTDDQIKAEAVWIHGHRGFARCQRRQAAKGGEWEERIVVVLYTILRFIRVDRVEVPFIARYRKESYSDVFTEDDLWVILKLDRLYLKHTTRCEQLRKTYRDIAEEASPPDPYAMHSLEHSISLEDIHTATEDNFCDLEDYLRLHYSEKLRERLEASGPGKHRRAGRKEAYWALKRANVDVFASRFILPAHKFADSVVASLKADEPNDPEGVPDFIARIHFRDSGMTEQQVIDGACEVAALELAYDPVLREYLRAFFWTHGLVSTAPTEKGKIELDSWHPLGGVRRLTDKPVGAFQGSIQFALIKLAEKERQVTVQLQLPPSVERDLFEGTPASSRNKYEAKPGLFELYTSSNVSASAQQWNGLRKKILKTAFEKYLRPKIIKDTQLRLYHDAREEILQQYHKNLKKLLMKSPWRPRPHDHMWPEKGAEHDVFSSEDDLYDWATTNYEDLHCVKVLALSLDDHGSLSCVLLKPTGEVADQVVIPCPRGNRLSPTNRAFTEKMESMIKEGKPDVIGIGAGHPNCRVVYEALLRHASVSKVEEEWYNAGLPEEDFRELKKRLREIWVVDPHPSPRTLRGIRDDIRYSNSVSLRSLERWFGNVCGERELEGILGVMKEEGTLPEDVKNIPVVYVEEDAARIYQDSRRAQDEYPEYGVNVRRAIAIGRRLQDPLQELCGLCTQDDDFFKMQVHPFQRLVDVNEVRTETEYAFVDAVNRVGVDVNFSLKHPHARYLLQFVCGLGPRKARHMLRQIERKRGILPSRKFLLEKGILDKTVYCNCAGFIRIRQDDDIDDWTGFDDTRIHPETYKHAVDIALAALDKDDEDNIQNNRQIDEYVRAALKLSPPSTFERTKSIDLEAYVKEKKSEVGTKCYQELPTILDVRDEIVHPFQDERLYVRKRGTEQDKDEEMFSFYMRDWEPISRPVLFELVTGENPEHLHMQLVGVQVERFRMREGRCTGAMCRLENNVIGVIDGHNVSDEGIVEDLQDRLEIGLSFTCRVTWVDLDRFMVGLTSRRRRLRDESAVCRTFDRDPYFEERKADHSTKKVVKRKRSRVPTRNIVHPNFANITFVEAQTRLADMDIGEAIIRPSRSSNEELQQLVITWKFYDGVYIHTRIREEDKPSALALGQKLLVDHQEYDDLDEILTRYVGQMVTFVQDMTEHRKFSKLTENEFAAQLKAQKQSAPAQVPYGFVVCRKSDRHGQFVIMFIPKTTVQKLYVTVTPAGFRLGKEVLNSAESVATYFKKNYAMLLRREANKLQTYQSTARRKQDYRSHHSIYGDHPPVHPYHSAPAL
eukprot:Rmarinus@m.21630